MESREEAVLIESQSGWILDFTEGYKFAKIKSVEVYENSDWERPVLDRREGFFLKNVKWQRDTFFKNKIRIFADLRKFVYCDCYLCDDSNSISWNPLDHLPKNLKIHYVSEEDKNKFIQEDQITKWLYPKKLKKKRFFRNDLYEDDISKPKKYYYNSWLEYKEIDPFQMYLSNCSIFYDGNKNEKIIKELNGE